MIESSWRSRSPRGENFGITYGPGADGLGDLDVGQSLERGHARAGDVAALGGDLVAAGAVLGEEREARRRGCPAPGRGAGWRARGRTRRRRRRARRSGGCVKSTGERHGSRCGLRERHVAGPQVEVDGPRADVAQRGALADEVADAGPAGRRDPLPVRARGSSSSWPRRGRRRSRPGRSRPPAARSRRASARRAPARSSGSER